jgi:D-amino peptidase
MLLAATLAPPLAAQGRDPSPGKDKRVPVEEGFRVVIVPDMEGMGSTVHTREVIAGTEGERYKELTSDDYWQHYRGLLTDEVNAVIRGARGSGARSFVVTEGHGGNLFANVLPWRLDSAAYLVRGYPKPLVMLAGLDSSAGTVMFTGAHANAGSAGVMPHNFAFDSFTVNGTVLNEVGINALIAGEMGVSVSLVSGDDVLIAEVERILGRGNFVAVVSKRALGRNAAITWHPSRVQRELATAAAEAVRRERAGEFRPYTLAKPYRVEFALRRSFADTVVTQVAALKDRWPLEKVGERSFRLVTGSAREMGYLIDAVEEIVIR